MGQTPPMLAEAMEDLVDAVEKVVRAYGLDAVSATTGLAVICGMTLRRSAPPDELENAVDLIQRVLASSAGVGPPLGEEAARPESEPAPGPPRADS